MKLGPGDECAAGHGPVPRKIEAFSAGTSCPSRHRDRWGKERQAGEVGIPSASPVGNKLNQEQYQSCTMTPPIAGSGDGIWQSWVWQCQGGAGTGAGTDLGEINMHLLWRPLGAALAQRG